MNAKQTFLKQLRASLRKYPSGAVDDYIEYYDELISERIANGEKETAVITQIGSAREVAASFKKENAINQAVKKPTISNGLKALIAIIGVLSLPLLIPALAVLGVLIIVLIVLCCAGVVVLVSSILAAILSVFDIASAVMAGDAPIYLLLLVTGIALIAVFLAFELIRGIFFLSKRLVRLLIEKLHARRKNSKRHIQDENAKEQ